MKGKYAGIGSQLTPADVCAYMTSLAAQLESKGWLLRSGGADGSDLAFERGVSLVQNKEIFLPWQNFNGSNSPLWYWPNNELLRKATEIASHYHPAWSNLKQSVRRMHTRNVAQILGHNLNDPVKMVICWTADGKRKGGTGQALRIATALGIPIFDLGLPNRYYVQQEIDEFVQDFS